MEKLLGKIESLKLGTGGYQGAMFGVTVSLKMGSGGIGDFKGFWSQVVEHRPEMKWTEADRDRQYAGVVRYLDQLCTDAKVDSIDELVGKPVEVTLDGFQLKSWRLLTEVL